MIRRLLLGLSLLLLTSCAMVGPHHAETAWNSRDEILGKSEAEILTCAGPPMLDRRIDGGRRLFYGHRLMFDDGANAWCILSVNIQKGKVVSISHQSDNPGGMSDGSSFCSVNIDQCIGKHNVKEALSSIPFSRLERLSGDPETLISSLSVDGKRALMQGWRDFFDVLGTFKTERSSIPQRAAAATIERSTPPSSHDSYYDPLTATWKNASTSSARLGGPNSSNNQPPLISVNEGNGEPREQSSLGHRADLAAPQCPQILTPPPSAGHLNQVYKVRNSCAFAIKFAYCYSGSVSGLCRPQAGSNVYSSYTGFALPGETVDLYGTEFPKGTRVHLATCRHVRGNLYPIPQITNYNAGSSSIQFSCTGFLSR